MRQTERRQQLWIGIHHARKRTPNRYCTRLALGGVQLKAEVLDGLDEVVSVLLWRVGVDAVSQVHDVVASPTIA